MQTGYGISLSPSFHSYSNSRLVEIGARVAEEFISDEFYGEFYFDRGENPGFAERETGNSLQQEEDDDEFEFAFVKRDSRLPSPVSADEVFCNGQIRPVYPVFNEYLFLKRNQFKYENQRENGVAFSNSHSDNGPMVRLPLMKLFTEERETTMTMATPTSSEPLMKLFTEERETTMTMAITTTSSSSSEADELDGVPEDTYCVWQPKEAAEERWKKSSSSVPNSKRWKFKELLPRSFSEGGKDRFVFSSRSSNGRRREREEKFKTTSGLREMKSATPSPSCNMDGGCNLDGREKRRSYLPCRKDLMGLFASVNGLSKNLHPF